MNPTYLEVFGSTESDTKAALASFGLPVPTDARGALFSVLERLNTQYQAMLTTRELDIYLLISSKENIDLDTQRRTYNFSLDLALVVGSVEDEAV